MTHANSLHAQDRKRWLPAWLQLTLAVGPVAVTSLMTASALAPFAAQGSPEHLHLSHSVVSGFVTGSALLTAVGQQRRT